jgi:hypothetical protein
MVSWRNRLHYFMNFRPNFLQSSWSRVTCAAAALILCASANSWAVLPYVISSSGTMDPNRATWTGNGTVGTNLFPGNWTGNGSTNKDVIVNKLTAGTLTIKPGSLYPNPRVSTQMGLSMSVAFTGGTGDILAVNSTNYDDSAMMYNSIAITDLQGVTSVSVTFNFTQPIAARSDFTTLNLDSFPVGAALGLVSTGGLNLNNFNVNLTYGGVVSDANDDGVFISGVGSARPLISGGWVGTNTSPVYGTAGATSFTSGGFTGLIDVLGVGDTDFLMVRGWDMSGNGTFSPASEADLVYVSSLTWTITPDVGMTFQSGTEFTFSMDGQQHANTPPIPEPSGWALVVLGGLGLVVWRAQARKRRLS